MPVDRAVSVRVSLKTSLIFIVSAILAALFITWIISLNCNFGHEGATKIYKTFRVGMNKADAFRSAMIESGGVCAGPFTRQDENINAASLSLFGRLPAEKFCKMREDQWVIDGHGHCSCIIPSYDVVYLFFHKEYLEKILIVRTFGVIF